MKVQCKIKKLSSIRDSTVLKHVQQYVHMEEVGLTVGRIYPVFGVAFRQGIPWYLICEELEDDYPPYSLLSILRFSRCKNPRRMGILLTLQKPCWSRLATGSVGGGWFFLSLKNSLMITRPLLPCLSS